MVNEVNQGMVAKSVFRRHRTFQIRTDDTTDYRSARCCRCGYLLRICLLSMIETHVMRLLRVIQMPKTGSHAIRSMVLNAKCPNC